MTAGVTLTWKPNAVLDFALARVQTGMNRATSFAANDARRRAKGARVKASFKQKVIADGRTVRGFIYTTWFVARLHELGTSQMAARPALRPAVLENGAAITRLIGGGS